MTPAEVADACVALIDQQPPEVAKYARIILRNKLTAQSADGCAHYYADPSGGFGWPSCVKCGTPAPTDPVVTPLRACCHTQTDQDHTLWCSSLDAKQKRGDNDA